MTDDMSTEETPAEGTEPVAEESPAQEIPAMEVEVEESPAEETSTEPPEPEPEAGSEPAAAIAQEPAADSDADTAPAVPTPTPAEVVAAHPAPSAGPIPSPKMFARPHATAALRQFGRVGDDGVVYVTLPDGAEREVGSYPGASPTDALAYYGRKYDEIVAAAELLRLRLEQTDVSSKDAEESYAKLTDQAHEPHAVGDLVALEAMVARIGESIAARKEVEATARAAAREEGRARREALVTEAEQIAGQPLERIQWKSSGARMRELLDEWKQHQRSGPRLDRTSESALWQRFSAARNGFDRARRTHFSQLDGQQSEAKAAKTRLVDDAERLATSKDWAPTASAFKRLMDEWRQAGRAGRADDDALWERFRSAQDSFFTAKDAVVAAEEESFRGNLEVKEALLVEAEQVVPVTDLERAKSALRSIQDRWDKAGKVPRADLERTEKAMRRIESAVREVEDRRWSSSNPEAAARAQSLVVQLEAAVAGLR
ncbi:MAG: DUF349 domain-containing protein, partial [Actinomycetota bacterium]|nr:DUF349 domain-containing protein [Actinomycetota bacterium]